MHDLVRPEALYLSDVDDQGGHVPARAGRYQLLQPFACFLDNLGRVRLDRLDIAVFAEPLRSGHGILLLGQMTYGSRAQAELDGFLAGAIPVTDEAGETEAGPGDGAGILTHAARFFGMIQQESHTVDQLGLV